MGTGNFDNDTACDWSYVLEESTDLSVIEKSLNAIFEDEYIDSDNGCEALAAIETIARLKGMSGIKNSYTETVDNWVASNQLEVLKELINKAQKAIQLILSESSELYELWAESDEVDSWKNEVKSLVNRLSA